MVFSSRARRLRKALGGGMRQVGILAAAGLYALNEIVPKLGEDHYRTYKIAEGKYVLLLLLVPSFLHFQENKHLLVFSQQAVYENEVR